jgi:hypothetical protein
MELLGDSGSHDASVERSNVEQDERQDGLGARVGLHHVPQLVTIQPGLRPARPPSPQRLAQHLVGHVAERSPPLPEHVPPHRHCSLNLRPDALS